MYSESMAVPNVVVAVLASLSVPIVGVLLYFRITRFIISFFLPKSGEGPSESERENGYFGFHVKGTGHHEETGEKQYVTARINAPNGKLLRQCIHDC